MMLNLPASTVVNRKVAKEKFYSHAELNTKQRACIREQIESVHWCHKLAPSTFNLPASAEVQEIQVFEVILRQKDLASAVLATIAKAIPYPILFALTFCEQTTYAIIYSGNPYISATPPAFIGATLDAVRDNLVRQLANLPMNGDTSLDTAIARKLERKKLQKEIASLTAKINREPQENHRHELARQRQQLQARFNQHFAK